MRAIIQYQQHMNLDRDGDVFVLSLGDGENRFNDDFLSEFNEALDEVESHTLAGQDGTCITSNRKDGSPQLGTQAGPILGKYFQLELGV
jgi:sugar lactone lactonase YvrE